MKCTTSTLLSHDMRHKYAMADGMLRKLIAGLFAQGSAYRAFRESYAANHESHLRVRSLPYTFTDFCEYVERTMELYKDSGIVQEACFPVIDACVQSIREEQARLQQRIDKYVLISEQTADRAGGLSRLY